MIEELIKQVDLNKDGKINFEEFVIMLRLHEDIKDSSTSTIAIDKHDISIPDSIMTQSLKLNPGTPDS